MYDFKSIDKKWQEYWDEHESFVAKTGEDKKKSFLLVEFPYPSGQGLHVGHPRSYTALDSVARKICAFEEVVSVFLMSGGFDLTVMLEGKSMREVALFVVEKLAVIDGVTGTATHFVLNKYKDKGIIFDEKEKDTRVMMEF